MKTYWFQTRMLRPMALGLGFAALSLPMTIAVAQEKGTASAAPASAAKAMPSGEQLMDEYAAALGGKELMEKFSTRRSEGTFEMKALGVSGKMTMLQAKPDLFAMTIDLPGIGVIENGYDGKTVWENSVTTGNRVLEGEEREQLLRRTGMAADAQWRDIFETVKTVREEKAGEAEVWVVELKPIGSDKLQTNYFDKKTKLLKKMNLTITSPMGDVAVEIEFDDYRKVDGLTMPFETRQTVLGQTQEMKFTKIVHDEKIADTEFAPPKD